MQRSLQKIKNKKICEMEFMRSSLEQVFTIPKAIFRLCFIIVNNAYCIPTYVVWMILLLPLRKINPETYWRIEGYFFHWLLAMVSMWSWSAGYDIVETGDDISECLDARTLVLSNHQSTADVPMLMACFNARRHILPNLMWIMDSLFKYTNFGIVSVLHQDFFIMSGKEKRNQSIQALTAHILTSYIPRNRKWMVLFPEGGFLRKRRANSQLYAEKHQLPVLQHVTLPRVGAMTAIMETLGPNTDGGGSNSDGAEGGNSGESGGVNAEGVSAVEGERAMDVGWRRSGVMVDGDEVLIRDGSRREGRADVPKERDGASKSVGNVECGAETEADPLLAATTQTPSNNSATSPTIPLATQLAFILDITIAYPDGPALPLDLKAIIFGNRPSCRTTLLYRLYKCSDNGVGVPRSGPELTNWLFSRWQEKDRLLGAFYRNGRFPSWYKDGMHHTQQPCSHSGGNNAMEGDHSAADSGNEGASKGSGCDLRESGSQQLPMPATLVSQDCLRFIILHLFFITSTYIHVLMFLTAYEYAAYFIFH